MAFDPTKHVQTRDGKPVRILSTDIKSEGGENIVAVVTQGQIDITREFFADGRYVLGRETDTDLINVPAKRMGYVGIAYGTPAVLPFTTSVYPTKEEALKDIETLRPLSAFPYYRGFVCVSVEWTEES